MRVLNRWQLSPLQLDIALRYLRLAELTLPLDNRSFGRTMQEFQRLSRPEYERMVANGTVVDDEIPPELAAALGVLTAPYLWVDSVWFPAVGEDHAWRAVAAVTEGRRIVLGVQAPSEDPRRGGTLTVATHDNATLPQVVLSTLPPAPPGNRGRARVPASSLRPVPGPEERGENRILRSVTPERGSSGDRVVELYEAIGGAEHVRIGQLAANLRDRTGKVRRSGVLHWFDNPEPDGRYVNHIEERGAGGEPMYLLTPADARLLGTLIDELVTGIR